MSSPELLPGNHNLTAEQKSPQNNDKLSHVLRLIEIDTQRIASPMLTRADLKSAIDGRLRLVINNLKTLLPALDSSPKPLKKALGVEELPEEIYESNKKRIAVAAKRKIKRQAKLRGIALVPIPEAEKLIA